MENKNDIENFNFQITTVDGIYETFKNDSDIKVFYKNLKRIYIENKHYQDINYLINRKSKLEKFLDKNIIINRNTNFVISLFFCFSGCLFGNYTDNYILSFIISFIILVFIIYIWTKNERKRKNKKHCLYELELDLVNKYITDLINLNE